MGSIANYVFTPLQQAVVVENLISIHYYEYAPNFMGVVEKHDFWELVYADSGTITCRAGDLRFPLSQGQLVLHPPNELHQIMTITHNSSTCIFSFSCPQLDPALFRGRIFRLDELQRTLVAKALKYGQQAFEGPYDILFQEQLRRKKETPYGADQLLRNTIEALLVLLVRAAQ